MKKTKYIFISGGVISGIGKGVATASISRLLKSVGFKVTAIKADPYINVDAGTLNPMEHGEVFVLEDGVETDQDLGHYERCLDEDLNRTNYMTTGQIYQSVIERERDLLYDGKTVEFIPHITDEVIKRIKEAAANHKADIVLIEIGGTVGEYQNALFLESNRIMKLKHPQDVLHIHLAYLPLPPSLGELKSKPVQTSVHLLNSVGIQPDFVLARSVVDIDLKRREKIATFCGLNTEDIISAPDVDIIYKVPISFEKQNLSKKILKKLNLKPLKRDLFDWEKMVRRAQEAKKEVKVGLVGKYFTTGDYTLEDSYISVIEALKHASWANSLKPRLFWFDSEEIEKNGLADLKNMDAIVVPGGFGSRGVEGIIKAIKFAREKKIPFLGLCFGLQLASVEFARNVCSLLGAHTTEIEPKTPNPIVDVMSEQEKVLLHRDYGGTMRLGSWKCKIKKGTLAFKSYQNENITERHRHRYEFNNKYRGLLEEAGFIISGTTPDNKLVEIIELANHPFFLGTQFHPEFKSRPLSPHPLYNLFIKTAFET